MTSLTARTASILFDEPTNQDGFEAAGHDRSAKILIDSVEQLADRDGSIGLEGDWGAGKSSVIRMAQDRLQSSEGDLNHSYSLFTFDLWTHQTDDFRRSFLEAFVRWSRTRALLAKQMRRMQLTKYVIV